MILKFRLRSMLPRFQTPNLLVVGSEVREPSHFATQCRFPENVEHFSV